MNALEFLISVLASLSALLTVLAAYKVMHSATNLKFSERALPQLKDRYLSNEDCDISSDTDVVKTVGIIRDSVSLLNKGLANTSESVKWYLPLLDNEFKASLVSTLSKCLHMPGNELSKQIIETLYASTSVFYAQQNSSVSPMTYSSPSLNTQKSARSLNVESNFAMRTKNPVLQ